MFIGTRPQLANFAAVFASKMHDARVLRNTNLFRHAEDGEILIVPVKRVGRHKIDPHLVGDMCLPDFSLASQGIPGRDKKS